MGAMGAPSALNTVIALKTAEFITKDGFLCRRGIRPENYWVFREGVWELTVATEKPLKIESVIQTLQAKGYIDEIQ